MRGCQDRDTQNSLFVMNFSRPHPHNTQRISECPALFFLGPLNNQGGETIFGNTQTRRILYFDGSYSSSASTDVSYRGAHIFIDPLLRITILHIPNWPLAARLYTLFHISIKLFYFKCPHRRLFSFMINRHAMQINRILPTDPRTSD